MTTKEYMHCILAIEPKWLSEVAPFVPPFPPPNSPLSLSPSVTDTIPYLASFLSAFFKVADASKISKRKKSEKIVPLFDKVRRIPLSLSPFRRFLALSLFCPPLLRLSSSY